MHSKYAFAAILFLLSTGLDASAEVAANASPAPLAIVKTFAAESGDARFDYAAIDGASRRLYVARGFGVTAVDLDTARVTRQLVVGQHVHAVVPLPGGRVLSTNGDSNTATLFEGMSGKVIAQIPTGKDPDAAVFDPASGLVFVMNHKEGDVTLIDPETGKSAGQIAIGGTLEFAVADGRGHVYVNIEDQNRMAVIDTATRTVSGYFALPNCDGPTALGTDPQSRVLIAACSNRSAIAISEADGKVVATNLRIDRKPDAVIFDAARRLFYIPCGRDGTLAVIAEEDNGSWRVLPSVPTAVGAHTGAIDPQTGTLYLPTADFHISLKGIAPADDTFRILVLGPKT
jgi:DNA-binding beta-propeller fold protein YncE